MPLVFAGPGIPQGEQCPTLYYLLEIYPTLCELLDLPQPESVKGYSLVGCPYGNTQMAREEIYLAYTDLMRGIRRGNQKLFEYAGGETQLFDLANEPAEGYNFSLDQLRKVIEIRLQLFALRNRLGRSQARTRCIFLVETYRSTDS